MVADGHMMVGGKAVGQGITWWRGEEVVGQGIAASPGWQWPGRTPGK